MELRRWAGEPTRTDRPSLLDDARRSLLSRRDDAMTFPSDFRLPSSSHALTSTRRRSASNRAYRRGPGSDSNGTPVHDYDDDIDDDDDDDDDGRDDRESRVWSRRKYERWRRANDSSLWSWITRGIQVVGSGSGLVLGLYALIRIAKDPSGWWKMLASSLASIGASSSPGDVEEGNLIGGSTVDEQLLFLARRVYDRERKRSCGNILVSYGVAVEALSFRDRMAENERLARNLRAALSSQDDLEMQFRTERISELLQKHNADVTSSLERSITDSTERKYGEFLKRIDEMDERIARMLRRSNEDNSTIHYFNRQSSEISDIRRELLQMKNSLDSISSYLQNPAYTPHPYRSASSGLSADESALDSRSFFSPDILTRHSKVPSSGKQGVSDSGSGKKIGSNPDGKNVDESRAILSTSSYASLDEWLHTPLPEDPAQDAIVFSTSENGTSSSAGSSSYVTKSPFDIDSERKRESKLLERNSDINALARKRLEEKKNQSSSGENSQQPMTSPRSIEQPSNHDPRFESVNAQVILSEEVAKSPFTSSPPVLTSPSTDDIASLHLSDDNKAEGSRPLVALSQRTYPKGLRPPSFLTKGTDSTTLPKNLTVQESIANVPLEGNSSLHTSPSVKGEAIAPSKDDDEEEFREQIRSTLQSYDSQNPKWKNSKLAGFFSQLASGSLSFDGDQLVSKSENVDFSTASTSDALTLQRSNPGDSSLMVNPSPVVEEVVSPSTTSTASSADALDLDLPESFTSPYFVFDPPRESSSNVLLAGEESCVFPDDRGTRLNEMEVASFSVSPDRVNASDSDSGETRHLHGMVHRNMDSLDLSLSPIAETCEVQECQLESMTASSVVESAHPSSSSLHSSIPDERSLMVKKVENNNSLSESNSVFRRFDSYSFESDQRFWNGISKLRSSGQFDVLVAAFPSERDFMLSLQLKYYAKYIEPIDSNSFLSWKSDLPSASSNTLSQQPVSPASSSIHDNNKQVEEPYIPPPLPKDLAAPHSESFMGILSSLQRGETPADIRQVVDVPKDPHAQPSRSKRTPREKPWMRKREKENSSEEISTTSDRLPEDPLSIEHDPSPASS